MKEPDKPLAWLDHVDIEDLLTGDMKLVYEWCGMEVLTSLFEHFSSMTLYVSTKPLNEAKKRYIAKVYNGKNVKALCSLLDVSERFVYETIAETRQIDGQQQLF